MRGRRSAGVEPPDVAEHDAFIRYIEEHGYREKFEGRTYTSLDLNGHRY